MTCYEAANHHNIHHGGRALNRQPRCQELLLDEKPVSIHQLNLGHPKVIHYNNQAVGLLMRERSIFQIKLRHVHIHQLWVRQEVQAKQTE